MKRFILHHLPVLIIIAVSLCVFFSNLKPDAWLMGWDHYSPHLATALNLERNIFGVWQEGRGLGLLDGLSHTANTMHTLVSGLLSIVVPDNLVRFVLHMSLFLLGGLGVYSYARLLKVQKSSALIGALFYQLNLMTIQMFHLPLEVFSVHFAAIPWLLWSAHRYLVAPSAKQLLVFFAIGILSSPQGYVPTVFLVFMGMFTLYLLWQSFMQKVKIRHTAVVFITLLASQAFWLVPYVYSFSQNLPVITEAKINRLSNQEILLNNREYGDIFSIFTYKGVYLSFLEATEQERPDRLVMQDWVEYANSNYYLIASLLLTLVALLGGVYCAKHHKPALFFVLVWLGLLIVLAATTPGVSYVTKLLDAVLPLFSQAYRFSFTKFSLLYVFCTSILLIYGIEWLRGILKSGIQKKATTLFFILALIICAAPVFSGKLFYTKAQAVIPREYFELQTFFDQQAPQERILFLPQPEVWGWTYNNWGFVGSGWIWQTLRQPVLDGAFYPWLAENENAYEQLERALNTRNGNQLKQTLDKYAVQWIVIDETLIHTPQKASDIKKIVELQPDITLQKSLGFLQIYAVASPTVQSGNVLETPHLTTTSSPAVYSSRDPVYEAVGPYLQSDKKDTASTFPFSQVWGNRAVTQSIKLQSDTIIKITSNGVLDKSSDSVHTLQLPATTEPFALLSATVERKNNTVTLSLSYPFEVKEGDNSVFAPTILKETFDYDNEDSSYMVEIGQDRFFLTSGEKDTITEFVFLPVNLDQTLSFYTLEENEDSTAYTAELLDKKVLTADTLWSRYFAIEKTEYTVADISKLSVLVQAKPISADLKTSAATLNCDPLERGKISREVATDIDEEAIIYSAENRAILCDHYAFAQASNDISYLLRIKGSSTQGTPLQFYVLNWISDSIVLQDTLPHSSFDTYYSLLSEPSISQGGISVNFKAKSFANQKSISELSKLELYPIPLERIGVTQLQSQKNTITTITADDKKIFPQLYTARMTESDKPGALVLNQSYHKAWIAFPSSRPWQLLDHRTYNGWANAWIVPAGTTAVTMLFWPQLLSFAGYGILVVTLCWLMVATLRQRPNPHASTEMQEARPRKVAQPNPPAKPTSHELHRFIIRRFARLRARLLGR